jgi:hypothetical protein
VLQQTTLRRSGMTELRPMSNPPAGPEPRACGGLAAMPGALGRPLGAPPGGAP